MKLVVVAVLSAFLLTPLKSKADAIRVNGTCELGNCSSPGVINPGDSPISTPFDFTYTFANTDSYQLRGTLSVIFNTDLSGGLFSNDFVVTYQGNNTGTASGKDALASDFFQQLNYPFGFSVSNGEEFIDGVFGPGLGFASSVSGQGFFNSAAYPVLGPFTPPPAEFSEDLKGLPFTAIRGINTIDYRYTLTFGEGSIPGSSISLFPTTPPPTSPVPEPSSLLLLGTGGITLLTSSYKRLRRR